MLDPNIIMGGQQLNVLGAMEAGRAAAESQIGLNRQNALASLYKTQGPQIMAGDANALNALARFDPNAAMGVQGTQLGLQGQRQDLAFDAERMEMARAEAKANAAAAIQERADQMSAQEAAAEAAKVEKGVAAAMAAQTPEQWDAMARQFGVPDLVGQFANREAIAGSYMGVADALKEFTPKAPDLTASQKDYQFYQSQEAGAGRQPLSFNDWDLQSRKASAANTTVTVGGASKAETAAFNKGVKADNVNEVIEDIKRTNASAILPTTGFFGDKLSGFGGTAAGDMAANIRTLQAAASFGSLQAMREASPTGGALGAVSDTEIKLLNSELAALEQSQSNEQFLRNLDRFQRVYNEIVHGPNGRPAAIPAQNPSSPGPADLSPDVQSWYEKYKSAP